MKICKSCHLNLSISSFPTSKWGRLGCKAHCKSCYRAKQASYYLDNKLYFKSLCQTIEYKDKLKLKYQLNKQNPEWVIKHRLRSRIYSVLKSKRTIKAHGTVQLLGIEIPEFKKYLESLFLPNMSWSNRNEWHIDHILPCCSFNLNDPDQQKVCFNYKNLRPLWKKDNLAKLSQDLVLKRLAVDKGVISKESPL